MSINTTRVLLLFVAILVINVAAVSILFLVKEFADSNTVERYSVNRQITFLEGVIPVLTIEGNCNISEGSYKPSGALFSSSNGIINITCKTGENNYENYEVRLSESSSYFVKELEPVNGYGSNVILNIKGIQ